MDALTPYSQSGHEYTNNTCIGDRPICFAPVIGYGPALWVLAFMVQDKYSTVACSIADAIARHRRILTVKELAQLLAESPKTTYGNKIALDNWVGDIAMGIDLHTRHYARGEYTWKLFARTRRNRLTVTVLRCGPSTTRLRTLRVFHAVHSK
jgi:hypothetical protein